MSMHQPDPPAREALTLPGPGPLLWRAWANAVVLYWESCLAHGALDVNAPVYVLFLNDAAGTLEWAMPAMLAERLQDSPCVGMRPLYVHAMPDGVNPSVYIGWRALEVLPSDRFAVHRGSFFVPDRDAGVMQWQACAAPPGRAGALLTHYAATCGSASLTLPMAACALLEEIAARSEGPYLLIGADYGVAVEARLRTGGCEAGALNLHALLLDCAWRGTVTSCYQPEEDGCAVWLVAGGFEQLAPIDTLMATLVQGHPQYSVALRDAAACLPPAHALQRVPVLLQLAGYDPSLLRACMPALLANAVICASVAAQWRAVLPATWQNYRMPVFCDDFYLELCSLAAAVGDWGLANEILHAAGAAYGHTPHRLQWLAYCVGASGAPQEAFSLLAQAVKLAPEDPSVQALLARARQRVTDAAMRGHVSAPAQDGELVLKPLLADHAPALLHQYRDPGIAAMADLAELHTISQVRQWIRAQRLSGGLWAYAVMHERWGFVGAVFLRCSGPVGYFYFWTGCDFQGRGYGPQAARLLWSMAARAGIHNVYTSVYASNVRSRRALKRLGFASLALRAQAPDDDMLFKHKALCQNPEEAEDGAQVRLAELQRLCRDIHSPLRFEPASSRPHPLLTE